MRRNMIVRKLTRQEIIDGMIEDTELRDTVRMRVDMDAMEEKETREKNNDQTTDN